MPTHQEMTLLRNMSIVPIIIFILFSVIITSIIINYNDKQLTREIIHIQNDYINLNKIVIKKEVIKIHDIIQTEYNKNITTCKLSEKQIKNNILKLIESIKYDQNGYIFIVDYSGNFFINIKQSLLSENQINLKDKNGTNITKQIIETAKNGGGYISYIGISGTHTTQSKKIAYIKNFEHWEWAIGYGFHPSDIQKTIDTKINNLQKEHQEYLFELIIITIGITLILSIILLLLSRNIENIFKTYKEEIDTAENKNRQKNEIIYHQSKMTVIGELLNMISHQWRQPLSQINAITLDMYLKQKSGSLNEITLKKSINDIENTTQYLSQTIDDFSRFFVQESKEKIFLVNDSVEHCISILNPSLHHIDLDLNFSSTNCVNGYITLFQQIILSLISNSIDIFNTNNISNPKITISTYDQDEFIIVEISDNGGGISNECFHKIFDLYFSTKKQKTSSGLGLYIAKKILEKNFDGTIFATNITDGVKFTIRIKSYDTK